MIDVSNTTKLIMYGCLGYDHLSSHSIRKAHVDYMKRIKVVLLASTSLVVFGVMWKIGNAALVHLIKMVQAASIVRKWVTPFVHLDTICQMDSSTCSSTSLTNMVRWFWLEHVLIFMHSSNRQMEPRQRWCDIWQLCSSLCHRQDFDRFFQTIWYR